MNKNYIIVEDKIAPINYINNLLKTENIDYKLLIENTEFCYIFEKNNFIKNRIICEILQYFYKYEIIKNSLKAHKIDCVIFAYIGSFLSIDFHKEKDNICKKIDKLSEVDISGLKKFLLSDILESWKSLGEISAKLLLGCDTQDDVYDLLLFMLGVDEKNTNKIEICNTDCRNILKVNSLAVEIIEFTGDNLNDLIINIFMYNPSDIVINNPKNLDTKLLEIISKISNI